MLRKRKKKERKNILPFKNCDIKLSKLKQAKKKEIYKTRYTTS